MLRRMAVCPRGPLVHRGGASAARATTPSAARCISSALSDDETALLTSEREHMEYDILIVGGGPAGLGAAIRLRQLMDEKGVELSMAVIDKAAMPGAHVLSGNVFEPRALDELLPDWREMGAPLGVPAADDSLYFLTEKMAIPLPTPPTLQNHGNYIISLGALCGWLSEQAENMGIEVYPGTAASEVIYGEDGSVKGIATMDAGIDKNGKPKPQFERGFEFHAKQTLFAEGVRGNCSEEIIKKFELRDEATAWNKDGADPQSYGLGIKEVWEIDPAKHVPGKIVHTMAWPLDTSTYGGSFLYHAENNQVYMGFVVGLDYQNPYLSPYQEFQRWKTHSKIAPLLEGGKCIQYGARCINEGGIQAVPKLTFPGGALIGCTAGFVNVPKIKGSHTAMKTGMLAGETVFALLTKDGEEVPYGVEVTEYEAAVADSWVHEELHAVRNVHPSFKFGQWAGMLLSGAETFLFGGKLPFTLRNDKADSAKTKPAAECTPIDYPKPDGKLTFDLLENLSRAGVYHDDDQVAHLRIKPELADVPKGESMEVYAAPETRFCPAKVYEYSEKVEGEPQRLIINAQNCVHCKCCSIKMPKEYINWTVPEGGGGPNYQGM